jgi:RNA polymerase sigma-70 factor (ECF subfamily)
MDESDRIFMESLYQDYYKLIFKHARRYFQEQDLVEDTVQQTCLKLIRYLPKVKQLDRNSLPAYIVNVVKSVAIDFFRRQKTERAACFSEMYEGYEETLLDEADLEDEVLSKLSINKLALAILKLPEQDQFVLNAKYLMNWSDHEIAQTLGIQKATVRTRLLRAKTKALHVYRRGSDDEE